VGGFTGLYGYGFTCGGVVVCCLLVMTDWVYGVGGLVAYVYLWGFYIELYGLV